MCDAAAPPDVLLTAQTALIELGRPGTIRSGFDADLLLERQRQTHDDCASSGTASPRLPNLYLDHLLIGSWLCYIDRGIETLDLGIRSSEILLLDKLTLAVRYCGSANDEGRPPPGRRERGILI